MNQLLLQITTTESPATEYVKESLFSIIFQMGPIGIAVLIFIFLMSIFSVYIFFERFQRIKKSIKIDPDFMQKIRQYVTEGKLDGAIELCRQTDRPASRMIEKGLRRIGRPLPDIKESIENTAHLEIYKLEKNINTLATISGLAPMLGFLGTVTGMINAFFEISNSGNNIDPGQLAAGIYEAMITTAFGLAVGIIAFVAYNYLVSLVEKTIFNMEASSVDFIELLQEPGN